nr:probable disease resistance protein At1g58602 [Quercus suber]
MVHLPSETSDQPELSPEAGEVQKMNSLARKAVGRCGGLPLSIFRLGYLFSGTKNVTNEESLNVLDHIDHNQTPWTEIMDFDVKDLPLRQCLSYFGHFPKDTETSARRLVALWVAEGLVKPSGIEQEPPELVARKILKKLINLNLVQVVERRPNGKEKTCSYPSALQDLWLRSNASFDQRIAYNADEHDASSTLSHGSGKNLQNLLRSCRNPRSILFFDTREGNKPGEEIGNFLSLGIASGHLLQLQVLDLEHVFRPKLPDTIGDQRIAYNADEHDASSTLSHGSDKDSPLKDSLRRLTNLRKLALAFQLNLSKQIALAESLLNLKQLKALKLKSIDEMGQPQDLKATFLLEFRFNSQHRLPQSLTDLTLSTSGLLDDPMPELEKLKKLECLSLYSGSYTGKSMSCSKGGFPQLHVLNFWMLQELEEWNVVEEAMPKLKKLEIGRMECGGGSNAKAQEVRDSFLQQFEGPNWVGESKDS